MATTIDRNQLKEELRKLAKANLTDFSLLIQEVVAEAKRDLTEAKKGELQSEETLDRTEIDQLIEADFQRFDDVFRALA
jgi:hypothetical protein